MAKVKLHLPSIFRSFSDKLFGILVFLLLIAVIASGIRVYDHFQKRQFVLGERLAILEKITFWEEVAKKYKGYRDGYFQLAVLEYQLGEKEKAKMYLEKVFELDPNFEEGRSLEKLL
ncbi:MAG: hypothetical protein HYV39_02270 [Candidatus Levybacteria bacterium]|nr:hypothetical protein [Candidatus Levybacteria bacterium]